MSTSTSAGRSETVRTCACGYDTSNPAIYPKPVYGFLGWFLLLMGASATPKRVDWVCNECKEAPYSTKRLNVRKKFR